MFSPPIPIETGMQRALIVIPILFGLLAITAVGLRVLARHIAHRRLDASDYTMIAALAVNVSFCGMIAAEPFTGCGIHLHDLAARFGTAPVITYTKMTIANQILWALAVCLSKLSILLLCIRVFTTDIFIKLARATGLLVVLLGTATVLGALLQCRPFAYNWDQTIPDGHCGDQVLSFKITASLNVVLDVAVLILPMPYLLTLQLALTKKLVLVATFAGGLITCIFSALRIVAIVSMDYTDITYCARASKHLFNPRALFSHHSGMRTSAASLVRG
ncbi:putative Integral membrane protein [Seiridium cardinale]